MSRGGGRGSKRNVAFIQGDEPKFLQEFKQRAGYLSGPALEEKFLGGKLPKKSEDDSGSASSDEEVDSKKVRRARGFSPTARFGADRDVDPDRPDSPDVVREDEKPLVVGGDAEAADSEEEDFASQISEHPGQLKSGESDMIRSLDAVYGRSAAKAKVQSKDPQPVDVDRIVATGGKFVFKKRTTAAPTVDADKDDAVDSDEAPTGSSANAKRWRQEQGERIDSRSAAVAAKKKSESRAVADRKLLSFDVIDD